MEEETKHINGKKTIFSLVSLDALPFSIIWCVFGFFKCVLGVFGSVVGCFECVLGVFRSVLCVY